MSANPLKKRLGPDDFGYTFVAYEPPSDEVEEGKTGRNGEADESGTALEEKNFLYRPAVKSRLTGVDGGEDTSGNSMALSIVSFGGTCCCLFAVFILAGGIFIAMENYGDDHALLAGVILFIVASVACICGCCSLFVGCVAAMASSGGDLNPRGGADSNYPKEVKIRLRRVNDRYQDRKELLNCVSKDVIGKITDVKKAKKTEEKKEKDAQKKHDEELESHVLKDLEAGLPVAKISRKYRPIAFYINFDGDVSLSNSMSVFRKQVSLIVEQGQKGIDQAIVVVTSPGGMVSQYGLAASQLARIRKAGIHLVVCIDTVAASGGFMMACVANEIIAAPFAVVGSIGVVTHIPNFQRFLNKHSIDAYLFTAGKFKRTVDVIGDVTEEGKAKLEEELNNIHDAFRDHVTLSRPKLENNIEDVATGEGWLAVQAKEKGLVDVIMTSDEYLDSIRHEYEIIEIVEKKERSRWPDLQSAVHTAKKAVKELQSPQESYTPMALS